MKQLIDEIGLNLDVVQFKATRDQEQAKASFWSFYAAGDIHSVPKTDLASALRLGRDNRIRHWWDLPGFREWFHNQDEFRQRIEFLAQNSLTHLESILGDDRARAGEKIAAIKLIMELSGKLSKAGAGQEQFLDERIARMNRAELEEFIAGRVNLLTPRPDDAN